jgi:hypothetical protein
LAGCTDSRSKPKSGPRFPDDRSLDAFAFNANANPGIAPNKNFAIIGAADMLFTSESRESAFAGRTSRQRSAGGTEQNGHSGRQSREVGIFDC